MDVMEKWFLCCTLRELCFGFPPFYLMCWQILIANIPFIPCRQWDYCCGQTCCRPSDHFFRLWYFWLVNVLVLLMAWQVDTTAVGVYCSIDVVRHLQRFISQKSGTNSPPISLILVFSCSYLTMIILAIYPQDCTVEDKLEKRIILAAAKICATFLAFLQSADFGGLFKAGWSIRQGWKLYQSTYQDILKLVDAESSSGTLSPAQVADLLH